MTTHHEITVTKLERGLYRISRDDGHAIEVWRGIYTWFDTTSYHEYSTLNEAKFDMRYGLTAHDICARFMTDTEIKASKAAAVEAETKASNAAYFAAERKRDAERLAAYQAECLASWAK